jgi:hypothetical protein
LRTSNGFPLKVVRDRAEIAKSVVAHIDSEQTMFTVAIDRNYSTCCNCGANVPIESDPCPECKTTFIFVVYGYIGGGNIQEQIDVIAREGFGLTRIGTYRGTPGQPSFGIIRDKP